MGVQDLLVLMKPFMGSILSYAQPVKPVRTLQVSRWPVDVKPITAPAVDFIGVDGSVLIHICLRRCMADIVINNDFNNFVGEMRSVLSRLQQTNKFCGGSTIMQQLFLVFDGKRMDAKLANKQRDAARAKAGKNVAQALTSRFDCKFCFC